MARRVTRHLNGDTETWDDGLGTYVRLDSAGKQLSKRALSSLEREALDPNAVRIRALNDAVDQLILDALMGGML